MQTVDGNYSGKSVVMSNVVQTEAESVREAGHQYLFVYGTLKRGDCRSHLLSDQRFIMEVRTLPHYRLYDLGSYPGIIEVKEGGIAVEGELWLVTHTCMAILDIEEGVPDGLYVRRRIMLGPPYVDELVQSYFYQQSLCGARQLGSCWKRR